MCGQTAEKQLGWSFIKLFLVLKALREDCFMTE